MKTSVIIAGGNSIEFRRRYYVIETNTYNGRASIGTVYLAAVYSRTTADGMIMAASNLRSREKIITDGAFVRRSSRSIGVTQKTVPILGQKKMPV